ncbi:alpha/beta hydrolase family protein [Mucilaginibacter antarcticus]|uniref:alpha/beta hydrolase family protein n=1 Tax=Mucilaginibacter antarcticus TaxID=1855725 RepID=UPI00366C3871
MKTFILAFVVAALCSCNKNTITQIPIEEFLKNPEKTSFRISPDGRYISYLKKYKDRQNIFIQSLIDTSDVIRATSFSDYSVRGDYNWTYDNQMLFAQDDKSRDKRLLSVLDVNTLTVKTILSEGKAEVRILNKNRLTPDVITISMNKRDSANFDVYRLNIRTGELKTYLVNPGNITDFLVDADANIRLVKSTDNIDETILYRPDDNTPFRPIIKNNFRNSVRMVAFNGVRNNFYALSNVGRDKTAFVEINAENGREERVIYETKNVDIQRADYSKMKSRLEFVGWEDGKPQRHFFNNDTKKLYQELSDLVDGYEVNITDRDIAENRFIIQTFTDRSRGAIYLYERKEKRLTKLVDNSTIDPELLCEKKPIHYTSSDGLVINGYLTLPLVNDKTNLPVIVMPHDAPLGQRDRWDYNADVQFFANRGFAVLQVNYRGSSGYGKYYYSAGFKEVGGKIQQDITDGVNWLIANKIANPKKVAIYGRGFGGFCALHALSFNPKLYSCAIVQNGMINLFTYIITTPPYLLQRRQIMYATIGDPLKEPALLKNISPVFHYDKPKVPVFFLQDSRDRRANIPELNHYIRELQKRNVPVKYSLDTSERGSVGGDKRRLDNYAEIEKFLDANMHVKP